MATPLFAQRGYTAVSLRDIAGACQVTLPTIYHFHGNKEALYGACCDALFTGATERMCSALAGPEPAQARIRRFVVTLCEILLTEDDLRRLQQREVLRREQAGVRDLTSKHFQPPFELFVRALRELDATTDATQRALSIYALSFGLVQLQQVRSASNIPQPLTDSGATLAVHVLSTVMPGIDWRS